MPNWVRNELIVAGPEKPVDAVDAEVWDKKLAARPRRDGFRFHHAVPAVAPGTDPFPAYPGGNRGEKAWGCRAVGSAAPHERTVKRGAWCTQNDHPHAFYFNLEDTADEELVGAGEPTTIRYRFDTAYTPCRTFVDRIAERYPHLYFSLVWYGEEPSAHGLQVNAPIDGRWRPDRASMLPPAALLEPLSPMRTAPATIEAHPSRENGDRVVR